MKANLVKVYEHTCSIINKKPLSELITPDSELIYRFSHNKTERFIPNEDGCDVSVSNIDTFESAKQFIDEGLNPMVLNMACFSHPGGGVANGARAQEEDLFRKSTYCKAVEDIPNDFYPLKEYLYSPKIWVVKDSNYDLLDKPFSVSALAVAAIKHPPVYIVNKEETYKSKSDRQLMQEKIDMIFRIGIIKRHDSLVLGALGCGAYGNPTKEVAKMYVESLNNYANYFQKIDFAVLSSPNNPNFDIFNQIIMD